MKALTAKSKVPALASALCFLWLMPAQGGERGLSPFQQAVFAEIQGNLPYDLVPFSPNGEQIQNPRDYTNIIIDEPSIHQSKGYRRSKRVYFRARASDNQDSAPYDGWIAVNCRAQASGAFKCERISAINEWNTSMGFDNDPEKEFTDGNAIGNFLNYGIIWKVPFLKLFDHKTHRQLAEVVSVGMPPSPGHL